MIILFIIVLFCLYIYSIILYKKQTFIEMFNSQCQRTDAGIPNTIYNQLLYLDKKLDSLQSSYNPGKNKNKSKYIDELNKMEKKYDWMANHYAKIVSPDKKAQSNANAAAEKNIVSNNAKSQALAKAKYKKHFKPGAAALSLDVGSAKEQNNFRKAQKDPNGRKNRALAGMKKKAKSKKEKKQVAKASGKGPGGIPPKQNTSVPSGPPISDNSFGAAFA